VLSRFHCERKGDRQYWGHKRSKSLQSHWPSPLSKPQSHTASLSAAAGLGLEWKVLPLTRAEWWFAIQGPGCQWREHRLPSSQLQMKASYHVPAPLICLDSNSWVIWPLNVCCGRDLYCGGNDGYLLELLPDIWVFCFVSMNNPAHLETALLPTLSLASNRTY
jgi:hypothetical protein